MIFTKKAVFLITLLIFPAIFAVTPHFVHAQTDDTTPVDAIIPGETPAQREARLQAELVQVEAEQKQTQQVLDAAKSQSASLQRDILILTTQIKAAQLNIKAKNLLIATLGKDISEKQQTITDLSAQIDQGHETLAQIMRKTDEIDSTSLPEIILAEGSLSDTFSDLDTFQSVQSSLATTFAQIKSAKSETQTEKDALDTRKNQETDALYTIQQEQKNIQADQAQKQSLLNISKNNELTYTELLAQKAQKAAQIRAALFALAGGAKAIPFGDALNYANTVTAKTGVPQAFLLAILTQETGIGKNVGTCYLTNTADGSGVNASTGNAVAKVMKPTRDVQPFLSITQSLGLDYKSMVVSCPQSIGYGGGMGPAQFIASTWSDPSQSVGNQLSSRVAAILGKSIVNPWDPQDAFMAAGVFLEDLGAGSSSYTSQRTAACKYYGGGSRCTSITAVYGNNVMALASSIQANQINPLQGL